MALLFKVNLQNAKPCTGNSTHLNCEQLLLKQSNLYEVEHSNFPNWIRTHDSSITCPDALITSEQRECDTFQFMVWDTGSCDRYIIYKV